MATINRSDILFATLSQRGRQILSLRLSGIASLREVVSQLQRAASGCMGVATLQLRNGTQGWSHSQSIMMRTPALPPVQLLLF